MIEGETENENERERRQINADAREGLVGKEMRVWLELE